MRSDVVLLVNSINDVALLLALLDNSQEEILK